MRGFVPALGTPLDENGNLVVESFKKQIEDQIQAGAAGLLAMGSMGTEAFLTPETYIATATAAVEAAAGRVPVFVGAMDTSIVRAAQRMASVEHLAIDGFVFTAPFYSKASPAQMMNFFKGVAGKTNHKILLYDLPVVSQAKITYEMVLELIRDVPNMAGIKSADTVMFRKLKLNPEVPEDFITVYSGLDMFDVAYKWGIDACLDGMLSCTPYNTKMLFESMDNGDYVAAAKYLDNITDLRDFFAAHDLWPCFSAAMNMLGYDGIFGTDYCNKINPDYLPLVREWMVKIGEPVL